jgi:DNA-binding NarL/FixJ family response regulator
MKRIFLVASHSIFGYGIASLLQQESSLDLVGHESDLDQALLKIEQTQPDVVVVATHHASTTVVPTVTRILCQTPNTVFLLSLHDNQLHIYRGMQQAIRNLGDLTKAIEAQTL